MDGVQCSGREALVPNVQCTVQWERGYLSSVVFLQCNMSPSSSWAFCSSSALRHALPSGFYTLTLKHTLPSGFPSPLCVSIFLLTKLFHWSVLEPPTFAWMMQRSCFQLVMWKDYRSRPCFVLFWTGELHYVNKWLVLRRTETLRHKDRHGALGIRWIRPTWSRHYMTRVKW